VHIDTPHFVGIHLNIALDYGAEGRGCNGDLVNAELKVIEQVGTAIVGGGLVGDAGADVEGFYFRAWNGSVTGIGDVASKRSIKNLRVRNVASQSH